MRDTHSFTSFVIKPYILCRSRRDDPNYLWPSLYLTFSEAAIISLFMAFFLVWQLIGCYRSFESIHILNLFQPSGWATSISLVSNQLLLRHCAECVLDDCSITTLMEWASLRKRALLVGLYITKFARLYILIKKIGKELVTLTHLLLMIVKILTK